VVIPDGGQLLSGYSLENAPYGFTVPADLKPTIKIDQKNLVTLGLSPADGMLTHDYLMRHLNTMGFSVDGSSADSLIFHDAHWQGALTVTVETAALTLRLVK
jgi:hypothetical protein